MGTKADRATTEELEVLATTDQRWEAMVPRAPFDSKLKDVYSYKGTRKAAEDHLLAADVSPYDGRAALREAQHTLRCR